MIGISTSGDDGADPDASMSSKDSVVESSYQRNPLHRFDDSSPPEKLGELFTALHNILLAAKILRRISKTKDIHRIFEVKGVLDKSAVTVHASSIRRK